MNISSIVIQTKPEHTPAVIEEISKMDGCEYHLHDDQGRIIATIEGVNVDEEIGRLKGIQQLEHVIFAEMMYSYSENELDELKTKLESTDTIPEWLNDENIKAEDIKYHGDLKKRF